MDLKRLKRFSTEFTIISQIGQAQFSKVYKVRNHIDNNIYKIKKIKLKLKDLQKDLHYALERVQKEAKCLAKINHPQIIRYFNSWIEVKELNPHQELLLQFNCYSDQKTSQNIDSIYEPQPLQLKKSSSWNHNSQVEKISFYIQTEVCNQTLDEYIQNRNQQLFKIRKLDPNNFKNILQQSEQEAKKILSQIVQGLNYLHNHCKVVHRDLTPGNIFLNNPDDVKIGDFGLVAKIKHILEDQKRESDLFNYQITDTFASPEQITKKFCDEKTDIYSFGLIILVLFHPTHNQQELFQVIDDAKNGHIPYQLDERNKLIANLIINCLNKESKQRPAIDDILCQIVGFNSPKLSLKQSESFEFPIAIGECQILFEDEYEYQDKFVQVYDNQLSIYKTNQHTKAQMIYELNECIIEHIDQLIDIKHKEMASFTIKVKNNSTLIYEQLMDIILNKQNIQ